MDGNVLWLALGFLGQALFALRFLIQWWRSERAGQSVVPIEFWYLSVGGAVLLLAYALHRRDPVFFVGQLTGILVYSRNLHLIHKQRRVAQ
ncbi:MAG TPA: lipid-A-disaccharide synthase N-terminal domain-containing protein [Gemmatimonadales bacterium]|jgi:lipid-A-disaccharide synthase-like uncharacterized protein